jgi:hypothetical protein
MRSHSKGTHRRSAQHSGKPDVGTAVMGIYASSLAVRQLPKVGKLSCKWTIVLVALPAMVIIGLFANSTETFFAFLGVAFAPMCGDPDRRLVSGAPPALFR